MNCLISILVCLLIYVKGMAQPYHLEASNAWLGMGAYSTHFKNAFSFISNPASLGVTPVFSAGLYAERKWMLAQLDNYAMAFSFSLGKSGMGIGLQRSGDMDYNEQSAELAYGKNLGRLEIGIRFHFLWVNEAGYTGSGFGNAGMGIRVHVSENLIAGWSLDLPAYGKKGKTNTELGAGTFAMGFGYEWGKDVFLAFQIVKTSGTPADLTGSLSYQFNDQFFFSFGMNSNTGAAVFQSGWRKNRLSIRFYVSYESVLGFSPGLILLWNGKNSKE